MCRYDETILRHPQHLKMKRDALVPCSIAGRACTDRWRQNLSHAILKIQVATFPTSQTTFLLTVAQLSDTVAKMLLCRLYTEAPLCTNTRTDSNNSLPFMQQHAHNLNPQTPRTRTFRPSPRWQESLRMPNMSIPDDPRPSLL